MEAALKATAATIKTLKEKLAELKSSACSLETCSRDSCNADQVTILDRRRDKNEIDFDFISAVGSLKKMAEDALGLGDTAFMSVVETNGIQTFSSVGSLTGLSTAVCDKIKAFKTNLDTNVKDRSKDLEKANEEMAAAVKEHTEKQMAYHAEGANYHGLSESLNFICNPQKMKTSPQLTKSAKK
ncbi:MAG: hypothetical protein IPN76_17910 [Saprospiraceae bacterium]|nr:hypothetical protein [Saprospiraceae bacterium]